MLEHHLARPRPKLLDPVGQVGGRIEPCRLRDPLQVQYRPEVLAPQRQQYAAPRRDSVRAFTEILDLQIGTDEDRRILVPQWRDISTCDHVSAISILRNGDVTERSAEKSSTPGRSQSPSGRMII